jgi:hypothetical protein
MARADCVAAACDDHDVLAAIERRATLLDRRQRRAACRFYEHTK